MLSGLFFVLTLWAYLDYVEHRRPVGRYLLVAMLLALGLLSKPMLVTLPPLLLLLDYWPLGRLSWPASENRGGGAAAQATTIGVSPVAVSPAERMSPIWLVVEKLPLVALAAGTCLMTLRHGGAGKPHFDWSLRIGGAATSALAYLADLFYPAELIPFYCYPDGGFPLWKTAGSLALLAAVSVAAIVWRRRYPYALVGWFWYLGMLVPVLGLVTISGHVRADRYTYLPGIGLYLALALGGAQLAAHWPLRQWMLASGAAAGLAALVACSVRQAAIWRDDETLWRETLARDPQNAKAEFALATALASRGQTDEAIALYLRAEAHPIDAAPFCNLGVIFVSQGKTDEAIRQYRQALAIEPNYYAAHVNLGIALLDQRHAAEAREHFETAARIQPLGVEARCGLAHVLLAEGKADEARAEFERALAIGPRSAPAHADLAAVLLWQGDVTGARLHCEAALAIAPNYVPAHLELAKTLAVAGQTGQAALHYQQVLQLSPGNLLARRGLDELQSASR
jgi:tetratricopeptide (TPR) repeat protein